MLLTSHVGAIFRTAALKSNANITRSVNLRKRSIDVPSPLVCICNLMAFITCIIKVTVVVNLCYYPSCRDGPMLLALCYDEALVYGITPDNVQVYVPPVPLLVCSLYLWSPPVPMSEAGTYI